MKICLLLAGCFLVPTLLLSQVGIGTSDPNPNSILDLSSTSRGFLVPRMSGAQRMALGLSSFDAGMMVYQTDPFPPSTIGLYYYDGSGWIAPVHNGSQTGQTLRWDGARWVGTSNLFNQGSSIGIGTQAPNYQLQIHSTSPFTRFQLTNGTNNGFNFDGLVLGIAQSTMEAFLTQNENRALCFGTNTLERMRIDSAGNIGIGTAQPQATLDINGSIRVGTEGSVIHSIIKTTIGIEIPMIEGSGEYILSIPCPGILQGSVAYVSPSEPLNGLFIAYSRVSDTDVVEVKLMNMNVEESNAMSMTLHIAVIQ